MIAHQGLEDLVLGVGDTHYQPQGALLARAVDILQSCWKSHPLTVPWSCPVLAERQLARHAACMLHHPHDRTFSVQAANACAYKQGYRQPVLGGHQQPALAALALWALHDVEPAQDHCTRGRDEFAAKAGVVQ